MEMQFLSREAMFYPHDPELERAMRVELYRKQIENNPELHCLDPLQRKGQTSHAVKLADIWSTETRAPMEFDTVKQAADFLGEEPSALRKARRDDYRVGGTKVERLDRTTFSNRHDQRKVQDEHGRTFLSIAEAHRAMKIPRQNLVDALLYKGGRIDGKTWEFVDDGVLMQAKAKLSPATKMSVGACHVPN